MISTHQKIRTFIVTCGVAGITVTGAWYGAELKTEKNAKKARRKQQEASPAEILLRLSESRTSLVAKKIGLEMKISELEARQGIQMRSLPK